MLPELTDEQRAWYILQGYEIRESPNGYWREWRFNNTLHREDGPAFEYANGTRYWYLNGKLHREEGPAVEYADGDKGWYLNDKEMTEEEHKKALAEKQEQ